jgi:hypothetical protein
VALKTVLDASGVGFGGFIQVGGQEIPFAGTFTEQQANASRTEREVRGYAAALAIAAQMFPENLSGASILIEGDNQGAVLAVNHFRSHVPKINEILKAMFKISAELRSDVIAKWIPRENLVEADALSCLRDPSDWGISAEVFGHACKAL